MKISKSTGMRIVTELSDIIHQRINLIDEKGCIIASTDEKRIGTVHKGAYKIISEHLPELVLYSDDEMEGSKAGLNLPLEMDGQYIGVVGISGEYSKIEKYGRIVKKMTEIFLLNEELQEQKRLSKAAYTNLLREWVIEGADVDNSEFILRAAAMKIDVQKTWRVMVLSGNDSFYNPGFADKLEHTLRGVIDREAIIFNSGIRHILLVPETSNERLRNLGEQMLQAAYKKLGARLYMGIDSFPAGGNTMRPAYLRAEKACRSVKAMNKKNIIFYEELNLEIFIREIPGVLRSEFIKKVFKNYQPEELQKMVTILRTLYSCNMSISQASEKLYMHKNTLQYKLNKLTEKTGINPRTPQGTVLYYLAIEFYDIEIE